MIYISHPYSGNEEENIKETEKIAIKLANKYPKITFINPLATFHHLEKTKLSYDDCLDQCLELLSYCDGVIFTGNWSCSNGCKEEYKFALGRQLFIYETIEDFIESGYGDV